jgi:hypothetical protein
MLTGLAITMPLPFRATFLSLKLAVPPVALTVSPAMAPDTLKAPTLAEALPS